MADFRKWFLVLAVVLVLASPAFADPFLCAGPINNPAVAATLRSGGETELLGDVQLSCTGGVEGGSATASIQVQIPGLPVSNRLLAATPGIEGYPIGAALQVKDFMGNPIQLVRGLLQRTFPTDNRLIRNVILFPNVTVPTGTVSTIVITNIRASVPIVVNTVTGVPVYEYVSSSPATAIPVINPYQVVGLVLPALQFGVTSCNGGSVSTTTYQQCISQPGGDGTGMSFGVRFSEYSNGAAFKLRGSGSPGNYESGVTLTCPGCPNSTTPISDIADSGTRLLLQFTNVPLGVTINVTDREIAGASASTASVAAQLYTGTAASGSGGTVGTSTVAAVCNDVTLQNNSGGALHLVGTSTAGSTYWATYEVIAETLGVDSLVFGVQVKYDAVNNPPALTSTINPSQIIGQMAPVLDPLLYKGADTTSWIPRFEPQPQLGPAPFAIVPCVTNLLFPYVTNTGAPATCGGAMAYDTGIALANTSGDNIGSHTPFGTQPQTGACHLYFFGRKAGVITAIPVQDTPTIPAGTVQTFLLSAGLSTFANPDAGAGFEGYIIARCDFQYAHGFAYIVDGNGAFGSESYLALVIPDRTGGGRPADPFTTGGTLTGEQLAQ